MLFPGTFHDLQELLPSFGVEGFGEAFFQHTSNTPELGLSDLRDNCLALDKSDAYRYWLAKPTNTDDYTSNRSKMQIYIIGHVFLLLCKSGHSSDQCRDRLAYPRGENAGTIWKG